MKKKVNHKEHVHEHHTHGHKNNNHEHKKSSKPDKKLGLPLSIFLWILLVLSTVTAIAQIIFNSQLRESFFPLVSAQMFYITGTFALISAISMILMLRLKKVGYYLYSILIFVMIITDIARRYPVLIKGIPLEYTLLQLAIFAIINLIPLVILSILIKFKWKNFK